MRPSINNIEHIAPSAVPPPVSHSSESHSVPCIPIHRKKWDEGKSSPTYRWKDIERAYWPPDTDWDATRSTLGVPGRVDRTTGDSVRGCCSGLSMPETWRSRVDEGSSVVVYVAVQELPVVDVAAGYEDAEHGARHLFGEAVYAVSHHYIGRCSCRARHLRQSQKINGGPV
jgi:hypothetical protein